MSELVQKLRSHPYASRTLRDAAAKELESQEAQLRQQYSVIQERNCRIAALESTLRRILDPNIHLWQIREAAEKELGITHNSNE